MQAKLNYILFYLLIGSAVCAHAQSAADGTIDAINQMGESQIESIQNNTAVLSAVGEGFSEMFEQFNNAMDIAESTSEFYSALQALDRNECVPDFSTSAESMMPSGCDEDAACSQCYESGVNRMNVVRRSFGRLSCIYNNTKRFTDAAIAFGDNVSGIHAVTGLAWQYERKGIQESFEKFCKTYDNKYAELVQSLHTALQDISRCEAQFGMRDWYQRFGFIYFEMMKEKYKRSG